jgi:glycosyltransferase involved in cell wall biosynthesis
MRVLLVNDHSPGLSGCGGVEIHVHQLKEALTEAGLTVGLLAGQPAREPERVEDDLFLIPHLDSPPLRKHALDNRRKQQAALKRAEELICRFRPDVIHVHNFMNPGVLNLLRACSPTVKSIHDVRPFCVKPPPITACRLVGNTTKFCDRSFGPGCFWRCYALAGASVTDRLASWTLFAANMRSLNEIIKYDRIVTYGTFLRDLAGRQVPDPGRIHIIHQFTAAERAAAGVVPKPHAEPVFIFAGRLSPEKGPQYIFDALDRIPDVSCRVILAGDGVLGEDLRRRANTASPRHRIELKGFLNQKQLYDLYRRTSVLLFPSIGSEGCPLVGLEAMSFGNTAIGFDTGGAGEWLVDGQTGIRAQRGNVEALSRAMARLAARPTERFRLRCQAQSYVRDKFKKEMHIGGLIKVYEQTIHDRSGGAHENR